MYTPMFECIPLFHCVNYLLCKTIYKVCDCHYFCYEAPWPKKNGLKNEPCKASVLVAQPLHVVVHKSVTYLQIPVLSISEKCYLQQLLVFSHWAT